MNDITPATALLLEAVRRDCITPESYSRRVPFWRYEQLLATLVLASIAATAPMLLTVLMRRGEASRSSPTRAREGGGPLPVHAVARSVDRPPTTRLS